MSLQACRLWIGGLEKEYMEKLAVYCKRQAGNALEVEVCGDQKDTSVSGVLVTGSADFVGKAESGLILTDTPTEQDETHLFRFQSLDTLYREIYTRCLQEGLMVPEYHRHAEQKLLTLTTDGALSELMAFSFACACVLADKQKVLYLNLSACSGMEYMIPSFHEVTMEDLILDMRKGETSPWELSVSSMGPVDYLMAPRNPTVLSEIQGKDVQGILNKLREEGRYGQVVVMLGAPFEGCRQLLKDSQHHFHLTGDRALRGFGQQEWMCFLHSVDKDETWISQVRMPEISDMGEIDLTMLDREGWRNSFWGQLAARTLQTEGGTVDCR